MRLALVYPPLIQFWISALYVLFLFISYASPLIFFCSLFLTYLLPYLSFLLRIDPLLFQAGCRKRWLYLALDFCVLFCVVVRFFWLLNACFCRVGFSFFHTKSRDWLGEVSPKWSVLCRLRCKTTTPSVPPWTGQEQHQGAESVDHKGRHLDLRAESDDYTKHV